jgi:hypothetical protein
VKQIPRRGTRTRRDALAGKSEPAPDAYKKKKTFPPAFQGLTVIALKNSRFLVADGRNYDIVLTVHYT